MISIIIPTYNRPHFLVATLDSLLEQTYTNWECILVDDGSTDLTSDVIQQYVVKDSRFSFYTRPEHRIKGPNSCRNYGFEKSCGDYILFFDSDDILLPTALSRYLDVMDSDHDAVICKTQAVNFLTDERLHTNTIFSENLIEDYFCFRVTFYVCGPLWRRGFLESQDVLFDEEIRYADDWDFNLRMLYQKPRLYFLDTVLIHYRWHKDSLSQQVRQLHRTEVLSDFKARDKHLKVVKQRSDVDLPQVYNFLIKRYKRYFKWAMQQDTRLTPLLIQKIIAHELANKSYLGALRSGLGYLVYWLTGKGYLFFKD